MIPNLSICLRLESLFDGHVSFPKPLESAFLSFVGESGLGIEKVREAIILASKAAFSTDYIAELCWSEDPHYVTGYVACKDLYRRLSPIKLKEDNIGRRVVLLDRMQTSMI
jgi:6-carboxyhexanoate--CoA ligase